MFVEPVPTGLETTSQALAAMNLAARACGFVPGRNIPFPPLGCGDWMVFMRRFRIFVCLTLAICTLPALAGSEVQQLVDQVSQSSYSQYLNDFLYTHTGDDRGYGAQHDLARANIQSALTGFGLSTSLSGFSYNGGTYYNVVAVQPGKTHPEQVYIIGAHYDSVNNPGADDNASGVAGVLEAARVLSTYQFDATIVYIAFDREEQGLIGSYAYVGAHSGDQILGMVAMDMIAYNPATGQDMANIYGRDASLPIKTALSNAMQEYGNGLTPVIGGDTPYSDHAPFEASGFQATLLIEYNVWTNPYYHSASDTVNTPGYIDYSYATNMTRSVVGYLGDAANLVPEPASLLMMSVGVLAILRRRRVTATR